MRRLTQALVAIVLTACGAARSPAPEPAQPAEDLGPRRARHAELRAEHARLLLRQRRHRAALAELGVLAETLRRDTPPFFQPANLPGFLDFVEDEALAARVRLVRLTRQDDVQHGPVFSMPLTVEVRGTFAQVRQLLAALVAGPRVVGVADLTVGDAKRVRGERIVEARFTVTTFRGGGRSLEADAATLPAARPRVDASLRREDPPGPPRDPFAGANTAPPVGTSQLLFGGRCPEPPPPRPPALPADPADGGAPDPAPGTAAELDREIARLAQENAALTQETVDLGWVEAEVRKWRGVDALLDRLGAVRGGPEGVLGELSALLTPGGQPTMTEEMKERVSADPNRRWNASWDPAGAWIERFEERGCEFRLTGLARSDRDVTQLALRMQASAYFREAVPESGHTIEVGRGRKKASLYRFTIVGELSY